MNSVLAQRVGPLTTIQDEGRRGLLHLGVSGSGPMDPPAMRFANCLVANAPGQAVLEFGMIGGVFEVARPVRFAVTGGAVAISVDGMPKHGWESHHLLPDQVLEIGTLHSAAWGYLALSGGFETQPVLGARSTHVRTGLGGLSGRRIAAGDRLPLGEQQEAPLLALREPLQRPSGPIRVIAGPQDDHFDADTRLAFLTGGFCVTASRDRMAQVLTGPPIRAVAGHDIVSDGTVAGSIQVPSSGRPIVLMAERQTTGGYPKIATVASVDLPRLAQAPTGSTIRFQQISRDRAEDLWVERTAYLEHEMAGVVEKA